MTKTWMEDGKLVVQTIPEKEIYKREWVGLTDEEQIALLKDSDGKTRHWLVWQVEAKCKEKNT